MKRQGNRGAVFRRFLMALHPRSIGFPVGCMLMIAGLSAPAAPVVTLDDPSAFFTNVASRLLHSEVALDLNNIQVYPTHQYTPSVHRLLQLTANIYDAATNQTYGISTATNGFPSLFRPLFRRIETVTNTLVVIAGYREVTGTGMANSATAPPIIDLDSGNLDSIPALGTPFDPSDRLEPMISGIPLVVGARQGSPNFNEFAMQPAFFVSRLLEFRRAPGNVTGPIVQTNQMYVIAISNVFGLEAWNSYSNPYPRNLQLIASAMMTAVMTNELGTVILSNTISSAVITNLAAGSWQGWTSFNTPSLSFILPWGTGTPFTFLTNSSYVNQPPWFEPQTHLFDNSSTNPFYLPRWWLNLKTQLQFILVDTAANRILDYVNLKNYERSVDITYQLMQGADCTGNLSGLSNPANQWCTNRLSNATSESAPPIGIVNQIAVCLGLNGSTLPDINSFTQDPYVGSDAETAIDSFRYNLMGWSPIFAKDQGITFYKSNVFYAPFDPYRPVYVHVSWQANDPLVHYTINDLLNLSLLVSNSVDYISHNPPLDNIGFINTRYQPWGGNPYASNHTLDFQLAVKDPFVLNSDSWSFPIASGLDLGWIGRVHRGTPWQTIFLKSTNILSQTPNFSQNLMAWQKWTGNASSGPDFSGAGSAPADAMFTVPTNDWHLVSLLAPLFSTNDLRQLASVNLTRDSAWLGILDGMNVLTDTGQGQLQRVVMSSNSTQAATIAAALDATRAAQPGRTFDSIGAILATPELSTASPWLVTTNFNVVTPDEAIEIIPAQLLPLLRPDSIGSILSTNGDFQIRFTSVDDHAYAVQVSSNLRDWSNLSTNYPNNGVFYSLEPGSSNSAQVFYRTVLLP